MHQARSKSGDSGNFKFLLSYFDHDLADGSTGFQCCGPARRLPALIGDITSIACRHQLRVE